MSRSAIRCRDIAEPDLDRVVDLLTLGFKQQRERSFWVDAIAQLKHRDLPEGYPRYGCLMESDGRVVGVILQIFSRVEGSDRIRCNFSSWWVMPEFRAVGALLVSRAFRHKVTYTNITPAPQTLPILEAQGYVRYCSGRVIALPMFARAGSQTNVRPFDAERDISLLDAEEFQIVRDHADCGCICLICEAEGRAIPFIFAPRRRLFALGFAVLVYASPGMEFAAHARGLGRRLAGLGFPLVVLDANGPIAHVRGLYFDRRPKYFRGPDRPRLNDHAYTERALFGS